MTSSIWIDCAESDFDMSWQDWHISGTLEGLWRYERFMFYQHTLVII